MKYKPSIFITSIGRTGTQFLGNYLGDVIDNCVSLHEPDVIWINRPSEWPRKLLQFGVFRLIIGRWSVQYSLRQLNVARQMEKVSDELAIEFIRSLRTSLISESQGAVYVEANPQLSVLVDLLVKAFSDSRVVFIIRDPRDWVRSVFNIPSSLYSIWDLRNWFGNSRLKASRIPKDPYSIEWGRMNRFEKLCWYWNRENSYSLERAGVTSGVKVFRYEDLFGPETRESTFHEMLEFITTFPSGYRASWNLNLERLTHKVHSTRHGKMSGWRYWDTAMCKVLHKHCGELMKRFGYGEEPEWNRRIAFR